LNGWTAKARKLAGILAVPAWCAAPRGHRVAAGDGEAVFTKFA